MQVINDICGHVMRCYLEERSAKELAEDLRRRSRGGRYENLLDTELAEAVTSDLRELSGDHHFNLSPGRLPDTAADADPQERYKHLLPQEDQNFGFRRAEILDGNIGYLQLNSLPPVETASSTAEAAMTFLRHARALVLDLRANPGGGPDMVCLIASYLLGPTRTELSGVAWRHTGQVERFWTDPEAVPFLFASDVPVAVLTGPRTGSAAEALAYDLQAYGRATVIGSPSVGAAHRVTQFEVGERFVLTVPTGRVTNPLTGGDWERTGVIPDIPVPESGDALEAALTVLAGTSPSHQ